MFIDTAIWMQVTQVCRCFC